MPARAIASGTVSFGLVSIPVKLYTTSESKAQVSFNLVHAGCGARLKQQYICPQHGEVVPREQQAKGYEFAKGQYVILSAEEIKALEAVSTNAIELTEFVPAEKIDPVYYDKAYYLGPDKGGERAYSLLSRAMRQTGLVGLAKYSARGKQYLVLVRPYDDRGLLLHQLRYADEVKAFAEVPLSDAPAVAEAELRLATQIIEQIAADDFQPAKYEDEVKQRVLDLIQEKVEGHDITAAPEAPQAQVIDLMEALKQSLSAAAEQTQGALGRKPTKGAARKGKSAAKGRAKGGA